MMLPNSPANFTSQIYVSPTDFSAVFASSSTLTLAGLPFVPANEQLVCVEVLTVTGVIQTYGAANFSMSYAAPTLTVIGAGFAATDRYYRVYIQGVARAFTPATNSYQMAEVAPAFFQVTEESLVDSTNVSAGSFPSTSGIQLLGARSISCSGKLIDGVGHTSSFVFEVTNDEDTAAGDWLQVYGWDNVNNVAVNSVSATNATTTFALSFDDCNYRYWRATFATSDAASNTAILKVRRVY